ncbi:MAG TPA: beta-ketoacyl synthase chain length factor [Cytophagaceae bacterium]|jgi:3-oxoacyl-[acyl-carrier-protein] synthase II|nr:beta-ketoacyl synthase chain length factor [Cytophagaceae bacterium]
MEVFINGIGVISPQLTFEKDSFSLSSMQTSTSDRLRCVEPDYKNYINPPLLRRMSRMIKMGITAAKICLTNAGVEKPGAIITGTGLGCIEDTEKFIHSIIENGEQLLTPTPFIQSTHNTVGGQIALLLSCHEYNFTYVHRGISFESALLDASMLLSENAADNILVGGIDELTDNSFKLLQQLGLYNQNSKGGEGAAFFLLSGKKTKTSVGKITALRALAGKSDEQIISKKIQDCLVESGKTIEDIGLVLLGDSGNKKTDTIYKTLRNGILKNSSIQPFKKYCGEYHTASSFAVGLATTLLNDKTSSNAPSTILIYNNFGGEDHSIILLEKC